MFSSEVPRCEDPSVLQNPGKNQLCPGDEVTFDSTDEDHVGLFLIFLLLSLCVPLQL